MTALPRDSNVTAPENGAIIEAKKQISVQEANETLEFGKLVAEAKKGSPAFKWTLEHRVSRELPESGHLNRFEDLPFRKRQLVLMRLHKLQSTVNLKPLPIAMGLFSAALATLALLIRSMKGYEWLVGWILFATFILLGITGVIMLVMIPAFTKTDANLTAWTEAFKDSHARQTKIEEEKRKPSDPTDAPSSAGEDVPAANPPASDPAPAKTKAKA